QMRVIAQNVEAQIIQVPTGCQDYYPALYGGVSAIHLDADGIHREAVPIITEEIERRFLLVYTGAPRQSGINNWEVFKAHINGDRHVHFNLDHIAGIAIAMRDAISSQDWDNVARLLREEWQLRKTNAPGISTPLFAARPRWADSLSLAILLRRISHLRRHLAPRRICGLHSSSGL